jgi:tetratricopeptide (TPR) repeat protein
MIVSMLILTIPDDSKLGLIYFNSFKYDEALYYFDRAKNQNIATVSVLKKMTDYFVIQGELDKAITSQKKITKILPKNLYHTKELSKLYDWNNQPKESLIIQEKIIKIENKEDKYLKLLDIQQGYIWLREFKEADRVGRVIFSSDKIKILEKNLNFYLSAKDQKEVIKHIAKITKLAGKKNRQLQKYLAQSYELNKDYNKAIENYILYMKNVEKIKAPTKDSFILNFNIKQLNKYTATIERILSLHQQLGNNRQVAKIYKDYYTVDSSKFDMGLDAAEIYLKLSEIQEVESILPKIYKVNSAKRLFRAGHIYLELKDYDKSIKFFERVLLLYPHKIEYFKDLSYLYELTKQPKKALELQYQLLKELKKNKQGFYFINIDEILISDSSKNTIKPTNDILNTQKKIIELLDTIGDKDEKHKKLIDFTQNNPYDFELNKKLAFSYISSGKTLNAEIILKKLFNMNPLDKDVNLYFVRKDIQNKNYNDALKKINLLTNKSEDQQQLKIVLFDIYKEIDKKEALKICKDLKEINNYDYVELKVNCLIEQKRIQKALTIIYNYSKDHSNFEAAKIKLAYVSIMAEELSLSQRVISDLKSNKTSSRVLNPIIDYQNTLIQKVKLKSSWEHSVDLKNFKSGSFNYWSNNISIYKNIENIGLGVSLFRASPNKGIKQLGHNNVSLKYSYEDNLSVLATLGNNFGNSKKTRYGISAYKSFDSGFYLNLSLEKNKQIYDTEYFASTTDALKDSQSLYIKKLISLKHDIYFNFTNESFSIDNKKAKSISLASQYNYYFLKNWSSGVLNSRYKTLNGDEEIKNIVTSNSNLIALNLRSQYSYFTNKLINITDIYVGMDNERSIDFGKYINIKTQLFYNLTLRKQFYFEISHSNESFTIESQDSLITSAGYNYWF